jgi:hypothetical protein
MIDWVFDTTIGVGLARLFNFQPVIRKENQALVATTGWATRLCTLGSASRRLLVDPQQRALRIRDRSFWFVTHWHRIPFDAVEAVIYSYADLSPGQVSPLGAYRSMDLFVVALRLRHGEERKLFRFFGQGAFVNNGILPDWCYWEEDVMTPLVQGGQESASRTFAEVLSRMLGVPIVNE